MNNDYKTIINIFGLAFFCSILFTISIAALSMNSTLDDDVFSVSGIVQDMQVNQNNFNITLTNGTVSFRSVDVPVVLTVGERYMFFLHTDFFNVTYLDSYALVKEN